MIISAQWWSIETHIDVYLLNYQFDMNYTIYQIIIDSR